MLLSIDEGNQQPIYLQIVRQIKEQILVGELDPGDELPSVRDLGDALGISLHTARSAYQVLSDEGLLRVRLGKKARIASLPAEGNRGVADDLVARVREVVIDGLLQGASADGLHEILAREVAELEKRAGTEIGRGPR